MRVRTSEEFRIAYKRLKKRHKSLQYDFERLLVSLLENPIQGVEIEENIMNTKNFFKAVAMAMLMPAVLLTTSCSKGDDAVTNPEKPATTEAAINKGYAMPVTVNVTRQGDEATTRATYNESTRKLEFTAGDKLFVNGSASEAGYFAGKLDYDAVSKKFSGTIYTEKEWTGTADDLFTAASAKEFGCYLYTTLLPAGYESYGFLTIDDKGTPEEYDDDYNVDYTKAFALTKAAGIEQFSYETANKYSGGFDLEPGNAILNFTITNLPVSTEVAVEYSGFATVSKKVTTDASGNATFVIGDALNVDFRYSSLSVGGIPITLVSDYMPLAAGKIYNINRAAPHLNISSPVVGQVIGNDGKNYAYASLPDGVTAIAKICYVSGEHGLALALADETSTLIWDTAISTCAAHTPAFAGGTWKLATKDEWQSMINDYGVENLITTADGYTGLKVNEDYYSSSVAEQSPVHGRWVCYIESGKPLWAIVDKSIDRNVRACLVF